MESQNLSGKRYAFLLTNGFEDSELTGPWQAVTEAGGETVLVAPKAGTVQGKHGHEQQVDVSVTEAITQEFDGLVLPGGVVNADHLRMDLNAAAFVRSFFEQHKPVGVICHGA